MSLATATVLLIYCCTCIPRSRYFLSKEEVRNGTTPTILPSPPFDFTQRPHSWPSHSVTALRPTTTVWIGRSSSVFACSELICFSFNYNTNWSVTVFVSMCSPSTSHCHCRCVLKIQSYGNYCIHPCLCVSKAKYPVKGRCWKAKLLKSKEK